MLVQLTRASYARTMRAMWPATLLLSFLAGVMVDVVVRSLARLALGAGSVSLPDVIGNTFAWFLAPLPIALAAAFSARAAQRHGARSVLLVLPLALSPHAYWMYKAERGAMMALAEGKWTAASLGAAFAWAFSVVLVTVAGALGLFLARLAMPKRSA